MPTIIVPLQDIVTDPQNPIDLAALPEAEAVEKIRGIFGFLGPLTEVQVQEGVAVITLPEEQGRKATQALEKIEQAAKAARIGRYQQALTLYQEALKVLPAHTTARRDLAMVEMEMGRIAAAKQDLIRVLQLDPTDAWAYTILGNLYFKHEKDLGSAERYYATAADLAPDDTHVLSSYGGLLAERGKYAEAEAVLRRAIAADPTHANPRLGLAMVLGRQGQTDAALAELEALFAQPADSDAAADARQQPVYGEARRLYRELRRQRGISRQAEASDELRAALEQYTAHIGIDIRIEQDADIDTTAKVELAWRYNRPYHAILLARGGGKRIYNCTRVRAHWHGSAGAGGGRESALCRQQRNDRARALRHREGPAPAAQPGAVRGRHRQLCPAHRAGPGLPVVQPAARLLHRDARP